MFMTLGTLISLSQECCSELARRKENLLTFPEGVAMRLSNWNQLEDWPSTTVSGRDRNLLLLRQPEDQCCKQHQQHCCDGSEVEPSNSDQRCYMKDGRLPQETQEQAEEKTA